MPGVAQLRQKFVGYLKNFEWHTGYQVAKALVIRDSDCHESRTLEEELAQILAQSRFQPGFPVHFYATKCMVEAWLLADEREVNEVARRRGKNAAAQAVADPVEGVREAKVMFRRMLLQAGLPDDPAVYGEVAESLDIDRVQQRCPYFQQFVGGVHAC